jgi:hypothetical protein
MILKPTAENIIKIGLNGALHLDCPRNKYSAVNNIKIIVTPKKYDLCLFFISLIKPISINILVMIAHPN